MITVTLNAVDIREISKMFKNRDSGGSDFIAYSLCKYIKTLKGVDLTPEVMQNSDIHIIAGCVR